MGQYSENLINNELNFNNQFDNIPDFNNLIDYNDYLPDSKTSENLIINDLHKNSYKPGEPFMDKIYNFENNDLIDFSPDNKENSKKINVENENKEINNNTNDNLINIIDLENIQTSSTFDAGKTLENKNILKDKDNNINTEEIDKILKNIENNILNEDFGKIDYQADNYENFEELPSLTEFEKGENQNKNKDLYTANEATNNDNYLSSTDNQNYQNIDLYTSNEAFNDNYLISTSTEIQNNEPNFTNEAFKDNDLLLTDNQNVDIYTQIKKNTDNYLSSIDNQIFDTYTAHSKKEENYLTSKNNLSIDSDKLLNDIINGNYIPSTDNQTNQNLDSYLTTDIININY